MAYGFSTKYNAKFLLEKQFNREVDYIIFAPEASGAKHETRCGHNREIIMMNVFLIESFEVAPENPLFHLSLKNKNREMKIIPPELWSQASVLYEPN